ncbi:MAG: glycosyltransferase family 2 protein [Planctomycetes bacterium]|nr:glycosyltransferase family 2 protein [Planctomycetota bacterium]
MHPPVAISIIIPVFNEEESLPVLHQEISAALATMGATGRQAEIIFVDDCSTDGSRARLLALHAQDPRVCVVRFRRNFGQTAALAAGFDVARGRVIVTLDGDLQNDPADIPELVRELERGYDIVAGWRKKRNDGFVLRRLPSLLANRLIAWVTGVAIHDTGCTLKAFRRELIKSMAIYAEQHRFLPLLSAGSGARISELVVNHRPRRFGQSKYGLGRATRVVLDLMAIKFVSQFSQRPIQYFGTISLLTLACALAFAVVALFSLDFNGFGEWEMSVVTILCLLFSAFVYFALLGLLGELAVKASGMHRRSTLDRILNELH